VAGLMRGDQAEGDDQNQEKRPERSQPAPL
jgi:hypothetical protein